MPSSEVMHKWKQGKLRSGSKHGKPVKSQKQAVAIMMSEKRKEKKSTAASIRRRKPNRPRAARSDWKARRFDMHGDLSRGEKKKLHRKLRHPKGNHKKNHMGPARNHKHLDGVRHHHPGGHAPKRLDLGNLGGDHPEKPEMSTKHNSKRSIQRREKRLEGLPI